MSVTRSKDRRSYTLEKDSKSFTPYTFARSTPLNQEDVEQLTSSLQAKWYNSLVAQLGVSSNSFQILQPSSPLGDTSDLLWAYFNNLPPVNLTEKFSISGGNRFYDDYRAVLSQLNSQNNGEFRRDLGDKYSAWINYVSSLNPLPKLEELPDTFRAWATVHAPDIAEQGATDLANGLNDPIFLANMAVQNQSMFMNGVPNFSQTIRDLRDAITQAESRAINFDSSKESEDISNTWANGKVNGFLDFFTGSASARFSNLSAKTASSRISVKGMFKHVLTFGAFPGSWYNSAALGAAHATPDNTLWKHGTPNWRSTFGPNGNMRYFTSSLIIVDGIDMTIKSNASFSRDEQVEIRKNLEVGYWPFFSLGASGGYTHTVDFDTQGSMTLRITNPAGNPVVVGANVLPASTFLTSQANQSPLFLREEDSRPLANAITTVAVPAQSQTSFPGRQQGYVIRISKQQWNHPVTYVVRSQNDETIAAGRVKPGESYSEVLIKPNVGFEVINVGVWPLNVKYPM